MNIKGQTALIMILVCAAALILLSITMNWGKIAQVKTMVTMAADTAAISMASGLASYGQMEKQSYLLAPGCNPSSSDDCTRNQYSGQTGVLLDIIAAVIAIIILVLVVVTGGTAIAIFLAALSVVLSVVNVVLQIVVVQPGITSQWNALQRNQPVSQQIFEGGLSSALQGVVTDQAQITDYLDWNANNVYGFTNGTANDSVSRFAIFYADRLRLINQVEGTPYAAGTGPCGGSSNSTGGTATVTSTEGLPNAVIYGWIDQDPGVVGAGFAHIVKVTAYSGGRDAGNSQFQPCPPWVDTGTSSLAITRSFTLTNRDGLVYVKVQRWDQDHAPITFPNGHNLWAMLGGATPAPNDGATAATGNGLSVCFDGGDRGFGYGLYKNTVDGINTAMGMAGNATQVAADTLSLRNAFMLDGKGIDSNTSQSCQSVADSLLATGVQATMCARYIAKKNATGITSGTSDQDYTVEFYKCPGNIPDSL